MCLRRDLNLSVTRLASEAEYVKGFVFTHIKLLGFCCRKPEAYCSNFKMFFISTIAIITRIFLFSRKRI